MKNFISLLLITVMLNSCGPVVLLTAGGVLVTSTASELAKKRSVGNMLDDIYIEKKIKAAFIKHGFRKYYTQIGVNVYKGKVFYTGIVTDPDYIVTAIKIAWQQEGVVEVISEIKLSNKNKKYDAAQYAKDSWITAQIKTKSIFNKYINFVNFTVITVNNVVYILGEAESQESLEKLLNIAATVPGVKEVINYANVISPDHKKKNYNDYQNYSTQSKELSTEESLNVDFNNIDQSQEDLEFDSLLK